jgi:microcystin-dependent protein
MSDPYVGEVRLVGFNFAPVGWQLCNGQLLAISENSTLFNLIGTTYGGDGQSTFALPDLRGRVPIHQGSGAGQSYVMGQMGGVESVTINSNTYPTHTHSLQESTQNQSPVANPSNNAVGGNLRIYSNQAPTTAMSNAMISVASGGSQPHDNIQPYQAMNWIISLFGIYPSQN